MKIKNIISFFLVLILIPFLVLSGCSTQMENATVLEELSESDFNCQDCNVIMIGMTNVRRDHMDVYGYELPTTPSINAFSRKAIVFENAFSPSSWTLPSITSIMTSLYPLQHGVFIRRNGEWPYNYSELNESIVTIADVLNDQGYRTAAFSGGFDLLPRHGVTSRFDENYFSSLSETSIGFKMNPALGEYGSFNDSVSTAIEWIARNKGKKFFIYLQGYDAHCPFALPEKNDILVGNKKSEKIFDKCYWTFDKVDKVVLGNKKYYNLLTDLSGFNGSRNDGLPSRLFSEEDIEYMVALYDGEIQLVDQYIGKFLDSLESEGLLDNTIVIIMSEHGDLFGKHGRFMRGGPLRGTFYDDVLHVPLIIYHPKFKINNIHREQFVELTDLAPTILDILSIDIPKSFEGKSIKPVILNDEPIKDKIFAASKFLPTSTNMFFNESTFISTIRTKDWKLIHELVLDTRFARYRKITEDPIKTNKKTIESSFELYNIKDDPEELINVIDENEEIFIKLKQELYSWIKDLENT